MKARKLCLSVVVLLLLSPALYPQENNQDRVQWLIQNYYTLGDDLSGRINAINEIGHWHRPEVIRFLTREFENCALEQRGLRYSILGQLQNHHGDAVVSFLVQQFLDQVKSENPDALEIERLGRAINGSMDVDTVEFVQNMMVNFVSTGKINSRAVGPTNSILALLQGTMMKLLSQATGTDQSENTEYREEADGLDKVEGQTHVEKNESHEGEIKSESSDDPIVSVFKKLARVEAVRIGENRPQRLMVEIGLRGRGELWRFHLPREMYDQIYKDHGAVDRAILEGKLCSYLEGFIFIKSEVLENPGIKTVLLGYTVWERMDRDLVPAWILTHYLPRQGFEFGQITDADLPPKPEKTPVIGDILERSFGSKDSNSSFWRAVYRMPEPEVRSVRRNCRSKLPKISGSQSRPHG